MGFVVCVPSVVAVLAALLVAATGWNRITAWAAPFAGAVTIAAGAASGLHVVDHGVITAFAGWVRVDALSSLMLLSIGAVSAITTTCGIGQISCELASGATTARRARLYGSLVPLTVAAMTVAVSVDNLGVMWVAIETTTIATVLLIGHRRDRLAVEAAWKYLILGSAGVATALLGTVTVYFVARHSGLDGTAALDWSVLTAPTSELDPDALRIGIGLVVVGFGTKAGLAPLHSWLPDAYSQAPGPVAGLMAGVVSTMSVYALLRFKVLADAALGSGYMRNLLIVAAIGSLLVAAALIIDQRDMRRLVAYSSVEHIGLVALALAIGSRVAIAAALLHLLGNGLAKSVTFTATGEIIARTGTARIDHTRGLLHAVRFPAVVFLLGMIALVGLPPFSLLASELALVRAGVDAGDTWLIIVALALMLVIFTAITVHILDVLTGPAAGDSQQIHVVPVAATTKAAWIIGLSAAATLGVSVWPIGRLLQAAARVVAP